MLHALQAAYQHLRQITYTLRRLSFFRKATRTLVRLLTLQAGYSLGKLLAFQIGYSFFRVVIRSLGRSHALYLGESLFRQITRSLCMLLTVSGDYSLIIQVGYRLFKHTTLSLGRLLELQFLGRLFALKSGYTLFRQVTHSLFRSHQTQVVLLALQVRYSHFRYVTLFVCRFRLVTFTLNRLLALQEGYLLVKQVIRSLGRLCLLQLCYAHFTKVTHTLFRFLALQVSYSLFLQVRLRTL